MRKTVVKIFGVGILVSSLQMNINAMSQEFIDMGQASQGIITIKYKSDLDKKLKLVIEKKEERYTYNINRQKEEEHFPLQMGSGTYKIGLYENTTGNKYKLLTTKTSTVEINDDLSPYLHTVQNIAWQDDSKAILVADSLLKDIQDLNSRMQLIRQYILEQVQYDYEKATQLESNYLPDIDDTLISGRGICYDVSSLFAAMLRSQGIPTKLSMGYQKDIGTYHSWNEVYNAEKDEWLLIDLVYDMYAKEKGHKLEMVKEKADYIKLKEY